MRAVMLAAGVGGRLYGDDGRQPPKCLMAFDGKSLLRRHIEILRGLGVEGMTLVVGYRKEDLLAEVAAIGAGDFVTSVVNPDFREGPVVSFWLAREALCAPQGSLFMDADVLYHPEVLGRLVRSPQANSFLFDRHLDTGIDPVRLCIQDGAAVDIGKMIEGDYEAMGEWPGFLKLSPPMAARMVAEAEALINAGQRRLAYEPVMRKVVQSEPPGTFGFTDVSDLPWIEIDFPSDVERAKADILKRIEAMGGGR
jgi:choline kinase